MDDLPIIWSIALDLWAAEQEGAAGLAQRQQNRFGELLVHARGAARFYNRLYRNLPADGVT
ncbi:MAG: hypothetical protein K0U61_09865, partial [Alphaproteobacteria bacterium]|nr:hypothetical protein [Alphaproteobacteria bacterium]